VSSWKAILAALIIFIAGSVTGALLLRMNQTATKPKANRLGPDASMPGMNQRLDFLRRLDQPLRLSKPQRDGLEQILSQSQDRMKVIWQEFAPRMQAELERTHEAVRGELTPEQRVKYDEILRNRNQHRSERNESFSHREPRRERPLSRDTNSSSPNK
jgi:hypothetical protein